MPDHSARHSISGGALSPPGSGVLEITNKHELLAIIVRASFDNQGVHFLTPGDLSQQLAFMRHPSGKEILPHVHNPVNRHVTLTQEALFIRKGRMRVDFYDDAQTYLSSYELHSGDVILLIGGGHGFVMLEDTEFVEVKQGPYAGDQDKTRFQGISSGSARVVE